MRQRRSRDRTRSNDGIAPLVELDHLRQQIRAHTVAVALDAVDGDGEAIAHDATATAAAALHRRRCSWDWNSAAKTRSAEPSKPAAPSGCLQAPRPGSRPA